MLVLGNNYIYATSVLVLGRYSNNFIIMLSRKGVVGLNKIFSTLIPWGHWVILPYGGAPPSLKTLGFITKTSVVRFIVVT